MAGSVGEAFVVVRPLVQNFRGELQASVNANLGRTPLQIPVAPKIPTGTVTTWEKLGGAFIPVPVTPTITPTARKAFETEATGLFRGGLLGSGQFAASRALGISGAAGAVFLFGKAAIGAVKSAATLEQELNVFQQVSGATADQMERVRAQARALGADISLPAVSAGDAAATMTDLAKAGLNVDEVLKGTRGTLQLAAAAQLDFGTAAELSANALNAFQLPGTQAVKVADLLAGAANAAQGDIADFGVGLSQSAAVAHQLSLSIQETVTFLTEFAKAGITGSDSGTSFRVALLRLIAPTSAAKKILAELNVDLEGFQSGRIRAPEFFLQLQRSMAGLTPATRNAALATLFGTDAVRVMAVAVRDAGANWDALTSSVGRSGQAQENATARTKGLTGSVSGLASNAETLGTTLGTLALGPVQLVVDTMSEGVTAANLFSNALIDLGTKISHLDLGPFGTVGDDVKRLGDAAVHAAPGIGPLLTGLDLLNRKGKETVGTMQAARDSLGQLVPPGGFSVTEQLTRPAATGEDVRNAALAGNEIGTQFIKGIGDGISKEDQSTVTKARLALQRVIEEGNRAVQQAITQGQEAIAASAVEAKQNLATIGNDLAQQAISILDNGPLAQRISALQRRLDTSRTGVERTRLRDDLRDAQRALDQAEEAIRPGAGQNLSATEQAALKQFLTPFREKVKDAKAALDEFNTEGTIERLQKRLDAQKGRIQKTLDDLIARFNQGLLTGPQLNAQVAEFLRKNIGPIARAAKSQGFAFRTNFVEEVQGLSAQIAEIIAGPQTKKTGTEPAIVSPSQVAAQAAKDIAAARQAAEQQRFEKQQALQEKIRQLHKDEINGQKQSNTLLAQIRDELSTAAPTKKPSSAVAAPKGTRTGGR